VWAIAAGKVVVYDCYQMPWAELILKISEVLEEAYMKLPYMSEIDPWVYDYEQEVLAYLRFLLSELPQLVRFFQEPNPKLMNKLTLLSIDYLQIGVIVT
jgi:hypothetical protein